MALFWTKGFQGASLSELVSATGLNRHSMYKEFGSKAGLFEQCLLHYNDKITQKMLDILEEKPLGLANIEALFRNRIDEICSDHYNCCLLIKTSLYEDQATEQALHLVHLQNIRFAKAFKACLHAGKRRGEIAIESDVDFLSQYLLYFFKGMVVSGRAEQGKKALQKQLGHLLNSISSQ